MNSQQLGANSYVVMSMLTTLKYAIKNGLSVDELYGFIKPLDELIDQLDWHGLNLLGFCSGTPEIYSAYEYLRYYESSLNRGKEIV
jgi:hypothetical protein